MTSNYSRRITALFLVLVMIGSPFSTGMVGASGPSDSQTVKITDGVDAWAGSPLTLQTQTDGATTIDDVPNTMTISGAVYGTPKLQPVSIFNPGSTVEFSYGSNSPFSTAFDLNESNTQIHIIKLNESVSEENVDASMIPGTPNELGDLLDKEDTNSNATFTEITSEVSTINDEFSFDHQFTESGQYTVMITSNAGPGSGIQLDGDKIDSINGEIDVIGLEPVAVQDNSVASISLTSSSEPGDNLTFDVKSGLGSDTNHVVAVYNKSTLKNEDIELETPTDIDDTTTADEFTISSSIGFVSGEAILENDVEVLGQTVGATNRNDGPFSVQNIVNRIADEASTETPKLDNDEDTLFASVTGVVGNSSEEVTVRTTNWDEGDYRVNWDEGDYRVVYIATSGDSSDEFSSAETSINIEVEETSGGDDDDDDDGGSGSTGGGSDNDDEPDDTTQDDEPNDDIPTVDDIRKDLDKVEPNTQTRTAIVDNDPDRPGVTVRPQGTESVREITFSNEGANGNVDVREWQNPPESVSLSVRQTVGDDSSSVRVPTVADIDPDSDEIRGSSAEVMMTVDSDQVDTSEDLVIVHERDNSWETLETTVEETSDDEITLSAETESFSLFAIAEVTEDSQTDDGTPDQSDGDGNTDESDDGPGVVIIIGVLIVMSLIAAVAFAYTRQAGQQGNNRL